MAWDKDLPAGGALASLLDNKVRDNNAALETGLNTEHVFSSAVPSCRHRPGGCQVLFWGTTLEITAALATFVHDSIIYDTTLNKFFTADGLGGAVVAIELSGSGIANAISTDAALGASDVLVPSQKAVKAVIETQAFTMAGKTLSDAVMNQVGALVGTLYSQTTLGTDTKKVPNEAIVKTAIDALKTNPTTINSGGISANPTTNHSQKIVHANGMIEVHGYHVRTAVGGLTETISLATFGLTKILSLNAIGFGTTPTQAAQVYPTDISNTQLIVANDYGITYTTGVFYSIWGY